MKKELLVIPLLMIAISLVCAEIVLVSQPESEYYSGQNLKLSIKIVSASDINNFMNVNLICDDGSSFNEEKFISLSAGEEEETTTTIPLIRKFVGSSSGQCKVKISLGDEAIYSNSFNVRNDLKISLYNLSSSSEYSPEETITINGVASKENSNAVNGVVSLVAKSDNSTINVKEVVTNGDFKVQFQFPKTTKAGSYLATLTVTERDYLGEITNAGSINYSFSIKQIPKNLEIISASSEVNPGEYFEIEPVLHDQTGENIDAEVNVIIKDSFGRNIFNRSIPTGESFDYFIPSNESPGTWSIKSNYNEVSSSKQIVIKQYKALNTEIVNSSLIVTNIGNVFFNDTISVLISDVKKQISLSLPVGGQQIFSLSAPNGVYDIEIDTRTTNASTLISGISLTGNAISIEQVSSGVADFIANPIVWVFLIVIFCGFAYFVYTRITKKRISNGRIYKKREDFYEVPASSVKTEATTTPYLSAVISSSIKGEKQEATMLCLKIKNFEEIKRGSSNVNEVLQSITEIGDRFRASTYENNGTFLFVFAPVRTKTFDNEKSALDFAEKIKEKLDYHNRYFKQRVDYGIGINKGSIVAKPEGRNLLEFSSLGNFANITKKIALISKEEILVGESVKDKLMKDVKFEKHNKDSLNYYSISEVKDISSGRERVNEMYQRFKSKVNEPKEKEDTPKEEDFDF